MGTRGECDGEVVEVSISRLEELSPTGVDQNRYVTICESTKTKRARLKLKGVPKKTSILKKARCRLKENHLSQRAQTLRD